MKTVQHETQFPFSDLFGIVFVKIKLSYGVNIYMEFLFILFNWNFLFKVKWVISVLLRFSNLN